RFASNQLRVEHRAVLIPLIEETMRARTTVAWEQLLIAAGVPHAPVWNYAELFAHPQAAARGLKLTVRDPDGKLVELVGVPFHIEGATLPVAQAPPRLGQDTERVLHELLDLDSARLEDLKRQNVI